VLVARLIWQCWWLIWQSGGFLYQRFVI